VLLKANNRHLQLPPALAPLIKQRRWLIWKWCDGKKPPIDPHGNYIDPHDSKNWMVYECALLAGIGDGLGFALKGSGIGVLDLDHCRQGVRTADWALALGRRAQSYAELSPSSRGIHILGLAAGGQPPRQQLPMPIGADHAPCRVEIYRDCKRYITITGNAIWYVDQLRNIDDVIDELTTNGLPTVGVMVGKVGTIEIESCRDSWQEVVRRRRPVVASYVTDRIPEGKRSDIIFKIVMMLRERGATPGEVAVVLAASRCFQDKWGNNATALQGEVSRIFLKPLRGGS
jgi:hypothetical protein